MSSFFQLLPDADVESEPVRGRSVDPWRAAVGVLAAVLLVGGVIAVAVGLSILGGWENTVLGQSPVYDGGVATAIVGGAAIVLSVLVGTCWLVLGAIGAGRRY